VISFRWINLPAIPSVNRLNDDSICERATLKGY
jgi:hypothetical protein